MLKPAAPAWMASPRNCGTNAHVQIVDDIQTLCRRVDAVLLESVDGRTHLKQVKPLFAAKKRVYIDKPLAASYKDASEITLLGQESRSAVVQLLGFALLGGNSALEESRGLYRTNPRVRDLRARSHRASPSRSDVVRHPCRRDVLRARGDRMRIVESDQRRRPGCCGRTVEGRPTRRGPRIPEWIEEYGITLFSDKGVMRSESRPDVYGPQLVEVARFFRTGVPRVDPKETLEIMAFMEAADISKSRNGASVALSEAMK